MSRSSRYFLLIPLIPTAIYVLFLLFYPNRDVLILWRREFNAPLDALLPLFISVSVYAVLALLLVRRVRADQPLSRAQRSGLIALSIVGGLAIQWSATRVTEPDPLVGIAWRTYAIKSNGYWAIGAQVQDVASFIGQYPQNAPDYPVHPMRHPPELSLVFWSGAQLFKLAPNLAAPVAGWLRPYSCLSNVSTTVPADQMASGAFGAVLEIVLAMLTALPLYGLVKRLAGSQAAVWAVLLYPLTPGFGMWVAQFDRSFALAAILILYLCEDVVTRNRLRNAFLAGLVLSVATFASFGNLPIGMFAVIYVLLRIFQTHPIEELRHFAAWRIRIVQAALATLGAASIWVLAYVAFGLNPVDLYRVIMDSHLSIDFPYWPFVVWNPWDIITFIGLPLVAITVIAGWKRAAPLTAAFCITLFTLSILGVARAETGRVWLFFTPLAVGAAAIVLVRRRRVEQTVVLGLLAIQL
ncbi:MAG TPA: glycosyltransferase family 39 protein, partial [Anaerolineae bacterium]